MKRGGRRGQPAGRFRGPLRQPLESHAPLRQGTVPTQVFMFVNMYIYIYMNIYIDIHTCMYI